MQRGGREFHGFDGCKVQELFCYLLIHHDRPHPREALASLLWGDNPTQKSKKYLRQTLWQFQNALESRSGGGALLVKSDWVRFDLRPEVRLDVIGVRPSFPAEFIIVRIGIWQGGSETNES